MNIGNLKRKNCKPFEVDDEKLIKIFSFFLHFAPSIDSATAANIEDRSLERNWSSFIDFFNGKPQIFLAPNSDLAKHLSKQDLCDTLEINRRTKGFICKRRNNMEKNWECLLRHIRNALAHNRVYINNAGNRKYLLFEDCNSNGNQSARILVSQTDLKQLKKKIME